MGGKMVMIPEKAPDSLHFVPLGDHENQRLGAKGSALVDYLLHPPQGTKAELGTDVPGELRESRQRALLALVRSAFE